jgi:hypothetical protein
LTRTVRWLLLGRYATLIAATALIPVPLLDRWIENRLRRRLVGAVLGRHGITMEPAELARLADAESGGCMGCLWSVLSWPVRKVLKTLLVVFQVKTIADTASEVLHRGLMLEEAVENGWLPDRAEDVRAAMDAALAKVDTRVVERNVRGTYLDHKHDLNMVIWRATKLARARAVADAADRDELGEGADRMSAAMGAAVRTTGLVPELIAWFNAEMGAPPVEERRMGGTVEPAALLPADDVEPEKPLLTMDLQIEDAEEVVPVPQLEGPRESEP